MKLEALLEVISDSTLLCIVDNEGGRKMLDLGKDGVPPYMLELEITDIKLTKYPESLEIGVDFDDFTDCIEYLRDKLLGIAEDLSDEYRVDSVELAKRTVLDGLVDIKNHINKIENNIHADRVWNCDLDD